jgi:hypothetical protein
MRTLNGRTLNEIMQDIAAARRLKPNHGIVYRITNTVTGASYIGATKKTVRLRWKRHKRNARILNSPLYRAIRGFGVESFTREVLATVIDLRDIAYVERIIIEQELPTYNVSLPHRGSFYRR